MLGKGDRRGCDKNSRRKDGEGEKWTGMVGNDMTEEAMKDGCEAGGGDEMGRGEVLEEMAVCLCGGEGSNDSVVVRIVMIVIMMMKVC